MLRIRIITSSILIALVFYCVSFASSQFPMLILASTVVFLAGSEFTALRWQVLDFSEDLQFKRPSLQKAHFLIGAAYALTIPLHYLSYFMDINLDKDLGTTLVLAWITFATIICSAYFYHSEPSLEKGTEKIVNCLAGFIYIAIPGVMLFKLSQFPLFTVQGVLSYKGLALYLSLAVVFMCDTGAYFTGRFFGKTPLIPRVSPKKTLEGAIGGLICSILTGILFSVVFNLSIPWYFTALIGLVGGIAGIVGDLVESALKRSANCKDSGKLLPGHGGILDRIDALLLSVPICYLLIILIG